jgi:hypothetical protein
MNEIELEFDIGLNAIKRQLLTFGRDRDVKSFRRMRISCLFLEALAMFALDENVISKDYYEGLQKELKIIYKQVKLIKEDIKKQWEKEFL